MNDRLRFRAWDKELNKMLIGHNQYGADEPDFNKEYSSAGAFTRLWEALARFKESNRFELMQWTGLKDSEGNLIYEGDVVEVKDTEYPDYCDDFAGETAVITYRVEQAKWFFEHNPKDNSGSHINELVPDFYHFLKSYDQLEYIKIIGNIYENSELLNA